MSKKSMPIIKTPEQIAIMEANFQNFDPSIKAKPRWIHWRRDAQDDGTYLKRPYQAYLDEGMPRLAKINDPTTWVTFEEALAALDWNVMDGIGYALDSAAGETLTDLDNVIDETTGQLRPEAQNIIHTLKSYTEYSQGGGTHTLCLTKDPPPTLKGAIEIYHKDRFVFLTGNLYYHPEKYPYRTLETRTYELKDIYQSYAPPQPTISNHKPTISTYGDNNLTAEQIIQLGMQEKGGRFAALFNLDRDWIANNESKLLGSDGDLDLSRVDYEIITKVMFYAGDNQEIILDVLKQSPIWNGNKKRPHKYISGKYLSNTIQDHLNKGLPSSHYQDVAPAETLFQKVNQLKALRKQNTITREEEPMIEPINNEPPKTKANQKSNRTTKLVALTEGLILWRGSTGNNYLTHNDTHYPINSKEFKNWLITQYTSTYEDCPTNTDLKQAISIIHATADLSQDIRNDNAPPPDQTPPQKISRVKKLVGLIAELELWRRQQDQEPFITLPDKTNVRIADKTYKNWLYNTYRTTHNDLPTSTDIKNAIEIISAEASVQKEHHVYTRYANYNNTVYIDLGYDNHYLAINETGCQHIHDVPIKFVRLNDMSPLPFPDHTGTLNDIRPFLLLDDNDFHLAIGYLLTSMKGQAPYYGLTLAGEAGGGKTTICKLIKACIDPDKGAAISMLPENPQDFTVHAINSHILAYDNVSFIPQNLSDVLCVTLTGGGWKKRGLWTNGELHTAILGNPIVFNGIPDAATAEDLIRRCLMIKPLVTNKLKDDNILMQEFNAAHPKIFGCLINMLIQGHQNNHLPMHTGTITNRMVGNSTWVCRCYGNNSWLNRYENMRKNAIGNINDNSLVYHAITQLFNGETDLYHAITRPYTGISNLADNRDHWNNHRPITEWKGTALELLTALKCTKVWPDWDGSKTYTPQKLGNKLTRAIPSLRAEGIIVDKDAKSNGRKIIKITRLSAEAINKQGRLDEKAYPEPTLSEPSLPCSQEDKSY